MPAADTTAPEPTGVGPNGFGPNGVDLTELDLTDLDLFAEGFPHHLFAHLRSTAPVFWHEPTDHTPDGEGFWVLSRYDDVLAAATDAPTFSSDGSEQRASGGGTLIEDLPGGFAAGVLLNMQDDPRHQRIRSLVTPAVAPRALAALEPELRARTAHIVDAAVERGRCDFLLDVAAELPLQAVTRLMGVPQDDRHQLFAWANTNLEYDGRDLGESDAATQAANAALFEYGTALVADKRADPDDGILSAIATATIAGPDGSPEPLSELEVQMFFNLLLAAGSETTRNSIAGGLLALVEQPDQWARLRHDRSLLPTAVEEILRWSSSTAYNRRTATRDVTVRGRTIRRGDKVTLWWSSANRDEAQFPDADRFDVGRHPNRHLAFGHGTHFCLGAGLARLEIRLVFEALLERVTHVDLAGPVEWTRSNKHTGIRHMPVVLRHP